MTTVHVLVGIVLLAAAAVATYLALPRNGQLTVPGRNNVLGTIHALGVITSAVLGIAFLLEAVLRAAGRMP